MIDLWDLFRHPDEQVFHFNHRKGFNDGQRFDLSVRQIVGKWDRLTNEDGRGRAIIEALPQPMRKRQGRGKPGRCPT